MTAKGKKPMRRIITILAVLLFGPSAIAQTFPSPTYQTVTVKSLGASLPVCTTAQSVLSTAGCLTVTGPTSATNGDFALFTSGSVIRDGGTPAASAFTDTTNAANIGFGILSDVRLSSNIPRLNTANTYSLLQTFTVAPVMSSLGASSAVCTDSGNHLTTASCAGSGNVTGPLSSTNGHFAVFNGNTGQIIADGGAPAASATTDTTVASNITSGTLPLARIAALTFGTSVAGIVPASGGGTTNFLRADGSWAATIGSGNVTGPSSSIAGDLAGFGNTAGTLLVDAGTPGTAAFANLGTSGATVPQNNSPNNWSGANTFSNTITMSALSASTALCTNGSKVISTSGCTAPPPPTITSTGVTANATIGTLPANATILYAIARETAGHNVTISLGTTSGATDVATPLTLTASISSIIPVTSFAKNWFSSGSTQAIFIDSGTWSSASVNISIYYVVGP